MGRVKLLLYTAIGSILGISCQPLGSATVAPKAAASICVTTKHHAIAIPETIVSIKLNAAAFPGWNPKSYDRHLTTDSLAQGCLKDLPIGTHWLMAYGYDPNFRSDVIGELQIKIQKIDENKTIELLVSETH